MSHPLEAVYVLVARQPLTADPAAAFPAPETEVVVLADPSINAVLREDVATAARIRHVPRAGWQEWIEADGAGRRMEIITNDEYCLEECAALRAQFGLVPRHPGRPANYLDKVVMKQALNAAGVATAGFLAFDRVRVDARLAEQAVDRLGLPLVAKPRQEANSRGVEVLETLAQLLGWQRRRTGEKGWHWEEFVAGDQFHVNGLVRSGGLEHVQVGQYVGPLLGFGRGRRVGSRTLPADGPQAAVGRQLNEAVVAALGGEGAFVVHTEYIRSPDGTPVVLEVAARAPGALVAEISRLHTGVNLEHANLALQAGAAVGRPGSNGCAAGWLWVPVMPGERFGAGPSFAGESSVRIQQAGRERNTGKAGRLGASVLLWSRDDALVEQDLELAMTWDWTR